MSRITIYHGSNVEVSKPCILQNGLGFWVRILLYEYPAAGSQVGDE